jgi:hypothetical protein
MKATVVSKSVVKNQKPVLVVKSDVKAGPDFIVKK